MTTPALKSEAEYALRPSITYWAVVFGLHLGAASGFCILSYTLLAKVTVVVAVVGSGAWFYRDFLTLSEVMGVGVREGRWWLTLDGGQQEAKLYRPPLVLSRFAVLYLRTPSRRWAIPLCADALGSGESGEAGFREMRALLRSIQTLYVDLRQFEKRGECDRYRNDLR